MARDDDETPWSRQLLVGAAALLAVAVVIGAVVGVVALGAAKVTGLGSAGASPTARASLYIPSGEPSASPEIGFPAPEELSGAASPSASPSPTPSETPTKKSKAISLQAFPGQARPNERINLTGVYGGAEGARLQVQRFEGRWVDFPVGASVTGGTFHTWVTTGREGRNRFRVVDKASGRTSNPVRVTVG